MALTKNSKIALSVFVVVVCLALAIGLTLSYLLAEKTQDYEDTVGDCHPDQDPTEEVCKDRGWVHCVCSLDFP